VARQRQHGRLRAGRVQDLRDEQRRRGHEERHGQREGVDTVEELEDALVRAKRYRDLTPEEQQELSRRMQAAVG